MIGKMPKLIIIAGPNGSGKSTLTKSYQAHGLISFPVVNPDEIAKKLDPEHQWEVRVEAGKQALAERQKYLDRYQSFAIETTLSGNSEFKLIGDAKQKGYRIHLIYVCVAEALNNAERVQSRFSNGTGHYVPPEDILRRREKSLKNLDKCLAMADAAQLTDNTDSPRLILLKRNQTVTYVSQQLPSWFRSNVPEDVIDEYRAQAAEYRAGHSAKSANTYAFGIYTSKKDEKLHIIQMNRQPSDELKKTMAETGYSWLESRKQFFCRLDGADIAQASAVLESSGFQRDDTSIDRLMNENNLSKHKDRNSSLTFSM